LIGLQAMLAPTVHAREVAHSHLERRHARTGVARRDHRVGPALFGHLGHYGDRTLGLFAQALDRRFVHGDYVGGIDDADPALLILALGQLRFYQLLRSHQEQLVILVELRQHFHRAVQNGVRCEVASHCIQCDTHA